MYSPNFDLQKGPGKTPNLQWWHIFLLSCYSEQIRPQTCCQMHPTLPLEVVWVIRQLFFGLIVQPIKMLITICIDHSGIKMPYCMWQQCKTSKHFLLCVGFHLINNLTLFDVKEWVSLHFIILFLQCNSLLNLLTYCIRKTCHTGWKTEARFIDRCF